MAKKKNQMQNKRTEDHSSRSIVRDDLATIHCLLVSKNQGHSQPSHRYQPSSMQILTLHFPEHSRNHGCIQYSKMDQVLYRWVEMALHNRLGNIHHQE